MPFPIAAAVGAAVLGFAGAQNCEEPEKTLSEEDNENFQQPSVELNQNLSPTAGSIASGCLGDETLGQPVSGRFVRFSESTVGSEVVRSMYSERTRSNLHRHMEVRLKVSRRRNANLKNMVMVRFIDFFSNF
jgi:hypothetical protein